MVSGVPAHSLFSFRKTTGEVCLLFNHRACTDFVETFKLAALTEQLKSVLTKCVSNCVRTVSELYENCIKVYQKQHRYIPRVGRSQSGCHTYKPEAVAESISKSLSP